MEDLKVFNYRSKSLLDLKFVAQSMTNSAGLPLWVDQITALCGKICRNLFKEDKNQLKKNGTNQKK